MWTRRATAIVIAASAMALIPTGTAGARAHLSGFSAFDQRLLTDMNTARADRGIAPLELSSQLEPIAYRWAQHLASVERAYNNPHFRRAMTSACPGWRHIGEAVGTVGEGTADKLYRSYMRDPVQRQTILSRHFAAVGVSTVSTDDNGATTDWNAIYFANSCS